MSLRIPSAFAAPASVVHRSVARKTSICRSVGGSRSFSPRAARSRAGVGSGPLADTFRQEDADRAVEESPGDTVNLAAVAHPDRDPLPI